MQKYINDTSKNYVKEIFEKNFKTLETFIKDNRDITSYVCAEPNETLMIYEAVKNLGIKVPEELKIENKTIEVGFKPFEINTLIVR